MSLPLHNNQIATKCRNKFSFPERIQKGGGEKERAVQGAEGEAEAEAGPECPY